MEGPGRSRWAGLRAVTDSSVSPSLSFCAFILIFYMVALLYHQCVVLPGEVAALLINGHYFKVACPVQDKGPVVPTVTCKSSLVYLVHPNNRPAVFVHCHLISAAWLQGVKTIMKVVTQYWPTDNIIMDSEQTCTIFWGGIALFIYFFSCNIFCDIKKYHTYLLIHTKTIYSFKKKKYTSGWKRMS